MVLEEAGGWGGADAGDVVTSPDRLTDRGAVVAPMALGDSREVAMVVGVVEVVDPGAVVLGAEVGAGVDVGVGPEVEGAVVPTDPWS